MKLSVGDKVKYLNATGGGVVTKVIDSKMVMVSDQDGFEIPTLISELVRVVHEEAGARFFNERFETPSNQENDHGKVRSEEEELQLESLDPWLIRNRKSEDIYLAYVPHDQKWLITGLVDVYLINNTSFDLIYNLFTELLVSNLKGSITVHSSLILAIYWIRSAGKILTCGLMDPFSFSFIKNS